MTAAPLGIGHASARISMEHQPAEEQRLRARRLAAASRQLVQDARAHVEQARQRLDRARNLLQVTWLLRALRERRKRDGS
jgi:hypothetical protein